MRAKKPIALMEIFLLISISFAVSVFLSGEVNGQTTPTPAGNAPRLSFSSNKLLYTDKAAFKPAEIIPNAGLKGGGSGTIMRLYPDSTDGILFMKDGGVFKATWEGDAWTTKGGIDASSLPELGRNIQSVNGFEHLTSSQLKALGWKDSNIDPGGIFGRQMEGVLSPDKRTFLSSDGKIFTWEGSSDSGKWVASESASSSSTPGIFESIFGGKAFGGGFTGALFSGAVWGAMVGFGSYAIARAMGQTPQQAKSIGMGLGVGTFVGSTLYLYGTNNAAAVANLGTTTQWFFSPFGAFMTGAVIATVIILATYKKEKKELISFECLPWEAPVGGEKCELCNEDPRMPCNEYRCKSLGQACEIVNKGTDNELCVWKNPEDTQAPHLQPSQQSLSKGLHYIPDRSISPPNLGFIISSSSSSKTCLEPYTHFTFGIETDEPSKCKADFVPANSYDEMSFIFGKGDFDTTHKIPITVPDVFNQEGNESNALQIHNNGVFNIYVRCVDANGNGKDSAPVAFSFCVKQGPDLKAPEILGSSPSNNAPVSFDVDSVPVEIYTNEPASCKWSHQDRAYDSMENEMDCAKSTTDFNSFLLYPCTAILTGIQNSRDNKFYFRCQDYSTAQGGPNKMSQSYPLTLKGTEQLVISSFTPDGEEIKGSQSQVPVEFTAETLYGAQQGVATCMLSSSGKEGTWFYFDETTSTKHKTKIYLPAGSYQYHLKCIDSAGNSDEKVVSFIIDVDTEAPIISRIYKEGDNLVILTNEPANCVYSTSSCNYDFDQAVKDGTNIFTSDPETRLTHQTPWDSSKIYYIKCQDLSDPPRRPIGNKCSSIGGGFTAIIHGSDF